jgi:hypothetical protein
MSVSLMSARKPAEPWYRQGWPWFLMAFPATAVVAGIATIVIAVKSNDGLVVDDYYKQGLAIRQTMARGDEARRLGLQADIGLSAESARVELAGNAGVALPDALFLTISHPTRDDMDQTISLVGVQGVYTAQIQPLQTGRWNLLLEDESRAWRLTGTMHLPTETRVRLIPPNS